MRLVDAELATLRVMAIRGAQTAASNAAMGASCEVVRCDIATRPQSGKLEAVQINVIMQTNYIAHPELVSIITSHIMRRLQHVGGTSMSRSRSS